MHTPRKAKVANFDLIAFPNETVACSEVPMNVLLGLEVEHAETHLNTHVQSHWTMHQLLVIVSKIMV